ncbi:MAG: hypothetical protein Q8L48_27465 [Archangium sp.]|nr:hypothetical protein [Archangium sp.]
MRRVVRLGRRRSAWESPTAREIAEVEFRDRNSDGLDLRPSVYLVSADDEVSLRALVVRVCAEHWATFISPPRPGIAGPVLDAEGASPAAVLPSPGETHFSYANAVHAELHLDDEAGLMHLVAVLKAELATRDLAVLGSEALIYVAERLKVSDQEWAAVLDRGWVAAATAYQNRLAREAAARGRR